MKLNFLCTSCYSWLTQNPSEIPSRCHSAYKLAADQYRIGHLDSALQSIGGSFAMSEIMLGSSYFPNSYASDWLVATSEVLVRVLSQMGRVEDSVYIYRKTNSLLSKQVDEEGMARLMPKLERIKRGAFGANNYLRVVH